MIIIMRTTLHGPAPNTYYGQWPAKKAPSPGLGSPAIARNELAARAGVMAFDVPERDFPGKRSLPCWKFEYRKKEKASAPRKRALGRY